MRLASRYAIASTRVSQTKISRRVSATTAR
jgi:hypothetical protein